MFFLFAEWKSKSTWFSGAWEIMSMKEMIIVLKTSLIISILSNFTTSPKMTNNLREENNIKQIHFLLHIWCKHFSPLLASLTRVITHETYGKKPRSQVCMNNELVFPVTERRLIFLSLCHCHFSICHLRL